MVSLAFQSLRHACRFEKGGWCKEVRGDCAPESCPLTLKTKQNLFQSRTRPKTQNFSSKKIADGLGLKYNAYINLETSLGIKKLGPFTTLKYSEEDLDKATKAILHEIEVIQEASKGYR